MMMKMTRKKEEERKNDGMESVGLIELSSCAEKVPSLAVVLCLDLATRMPESHTNQITQNYYKFEFTQSQSRFFPIVPPAPLLYTFKPQQTCFANNWKESLRIPL